MLAIIDTETTGLEPGHHEVIEIATILCDWDLNEIVSMETKVMPEHLDRASRRALEVNGFNRRDWKDAPSLSRWHEWMLEHAGEKPTPCGHSIDFDLQMIAKNPSYPVGLSYIFDYNKLDTVSVGALLRVIGVDLGSLSLGKLGAALGVDAPVRHRAMADARICLGILRKVKTQLSFSGRS